MRKILIIVFTLFSLNLFAQGKFDVQGDLAPTGAYGVVKARNLRGGYLGSVYDTIARNLIPLNYRDSNTLVYTRIDSTMWMLKGGLANSNWKVFSTGGGGGSVGTLQQVTDLENTTTNLIDISNQNPLHFYNNITDGDLTLSISNIGSNSLIQSFPSKNGTFAMTSDTITLSNRIDARVKYTDTSSMLSNYAKTSNVNGLLALKLNINDTSTMLSPYYRTATATTALSTKLNISDSSTMLTNYIKAAGFGLTKSSQSLLADSTLLSTRAWRQKGLDSLAAIELNVSDTNVFARKLIQTNRQTASYTLALTDLNQLVEINNASANTLTVPLFSSIAFAIGSKIDIAQYGAGQTTITPASGVMIRSYSGALKIAGQYGACTLVKIGTNEWYCFGNLTL